MGWNELLLFSLEGHDQGGVDHDNYGPDEGKEQDQPLEAGDELVPLQHEELLEHVRGLEGCLHGALVHH